MTHSILEAGHYPEVRFSPKTFSGSLVVSSSSNVTVAGTFLIHGQEHEVTIPMHVQMSADEMNATGTFLVPYVQWGMKNPSTFILKVNDKVQIDLTVVARRVPSRP
jgi:polyisoprenoid-binding protein YceI